jgi:crotonobetainyl-CoA:carnitine CoA-transferase CaiB-like acyl-CoA transferase
MTELRPLREVAVVEVGEGAGLRLCGKLLSDAGASVTHVDLGGSQSPPAGAEPFADGVKRNITLDPDDPADSAALEELLGDAGLYLTSLRHEPGARWSLDCDSVLDRHERLVAACVTPFGQSGPYADFSSDDVVLAALSGLANATPGFPDRCPPGDPPVQSRARLAESGGAFMAAVAAFGALMPALLGKEGPRHVEVALLEAVVAQMAYEWGITAYGGGVAARHTTHHELEPNVYLPCRDGWVIMVAFTEPHWHSLVDLMGSPEWAFEPEYETAQSRGVHYRSLHGHIAEWTRWQLGMDVLREAQARGLPCCCSLELAQTVSSEQVREMGSVTEEDGVVVPSDPILVNGRRRPRRAPPASVALGTAKLPARHASSSDGPARAPLAGVRVLDLSQIVSGPYAGQLLAALGADVVLVETSQRLISRGFGPFVGEPAYDASAMFNQINQGKRSVELNLASDAGRELLLELVSEADVVLENFSGRAARALGITHEELREVREDIVLASISGFGRSGPWGDYVALHSGVILLSGLASVTRDSGGDMRLAGAIYPDLLTGTYMALAIEQALAERALTGLGCHIEVSMLDVMLSCMGDLVPAAAAGESIGPSPARFLSSVEPDRFVATSATKAAPGDVARLTRREAMETLQAAGVAAAAVLDTTEVIADEHLAARGFVREDDHPVAGPRSIPAVPWSYDGQRPVLHHSPCFGDGTEAVLAGLHGRTIDDLNRLRTQGVLI